MSDVIAHIDRVEREEVLRIWAYQCPIASGSIQRHLEEAGRLDAMRVAVELGHIALRLSRLDRATAEEMTS